MEDSERIRKINEFLNERRSKRLERIFNEINGKGMLDDILDDESRKIFLDTLKFALVYDSSKDRPKNIGLNSDMFYRLFNDIEGNFVFRNGTNVLNYMKLFRREVKDYFNRAISDQEYFKSEILNQDLVLYFMP